LTGSPTATSTRTSATSVTATGWTSSGGGSAADCPCRIHPTICAAKSKNCVARTALAGTGPDSASRSCSRLPA
jgi:hypothetical protein